MPVGLCYVFQVEDHGSKRDQQRFLFKRSAMQMCNANMHEFADLSRFLKKTCALLMNFHNFF